MAKITPPLTCYAEVLKALEAIDAPYMTIGAFAAGAYGSNRTTHDVDMIVALTESHLVPLAARFPGPPITPTPTRCGMPWRMEPYSISLIASEGKKWT